MSRHASVTHVQDTHLGMIRVKPNLSFQQGCSFVRRQYGFEDVVCLRELTSYHNQNLLMEGRRPSKGETGPARERFILKVLNSEDSELFDAYKLQNDILVSCGEDFGIPCPQPFSDQHGDDIILHKLRFREKDSGKEHEGLFILRVMKFIPGQYVRSAPLFTTKMCYEIGELLSTVQLAFQDFTGDLAPFVEKERRYLWSLRKAPLVRRHLHLVTDESRRQLIQSVLEAFEEKVLSTEDRLKKGLIHGDFNEFNILVRNASKSMSVSGEGSNAIYIGGRNDVIGIVDFDDMMYTCRVYDLALALMYMMQCPNLERSPLESAGVLLAGYLARSACALDQLDWQVLYYCVAARFAQSLMLGLHTYSLQPQNDYILSTQVKGWDVLRELWQQDVDDLNSRWRKVIEDYVCV